MQLPISKAAGLANCTVLRWAQSITKSGAALQHELKPVALFYQTGIVVLFLSLLLQGLYITSFHITSLDCILGVADH